MAILQTGPLVVDPYNLDHTAARFRNLDITNLASAAGRTGQDVDAAAGGGPAAGAALAAAQHVADLLNRLESGLVGVSNALAQSSAAYSQTDAAVRREMQ